MHYHHQSLSPYRFHLTCRNSHQHQLKNLRMTMILVSIVQDDEAQFEQQPTTLARAGQVQYQPRTLLTENFIYTSYATEFLCLH